MDVYPCDPDLCISRFGAHNVDDPTQVLALFQLASLWFSSVAEIVNQMDSIEEVGNLRFKKQPSHGVETVTWHLNEDPKTYRGTLYRITTSGLAATHHYVFAISGFLAREEVERYAQDQLFGYSVERVEKVPGEEYESLPLLVPIIDTQHEEEDK